MKRVVGLGACVYDTLISVAAFPEEDKKFRAESTLVSGGGPVSNALVVLSRLGVSAEYIGALADDAAGRFLASDFAAFGVETGRARLLGGKKSFTSYILLSAATGSRTCVFDRGTVPDDPANVDLSALDGADALHLDGNYLLSAIRAAERARDLGVPVSLDAGGRYEGIEKLLPLVDILIPSAEFATGLTGERTIPKAMDALFAAYRPRVLVVTDGKNGGYFYGHGAEKYDGVPVRAADTNGAGDTFHGAFLAAHLAGKTTAECCKFAAAVAAYKCRFVGARSYPLDPSIAEKL